MALCVGVICNYYPPSVGGIAAQVQDTARSLAQLGVELHIITRQWSPASETISHSQEGAGITVHRVSVGKERWRATPAFTWQSANLIRKLSPAVIHAHELQLTNPALLAKRLTGLPVVVSVHSSGSALGECARMRRAPFGRRRLQYLGRAVDRFVAISRAVEADMDLVGLPQQKRVVIPNGIDMDRFHPVAEDQKANLRRQLGLPEGALVVYTGRLSSEKRILQLVQQWAIIRQHYPDVSLIVVGDGPQYAELQSSHAPNVFLTGLQDDVAPYLQAADLFVLPSVSEGFSLSALEALACGLPAVTTTVGALPELVIDGTTGRLVAPDDLPALRDALCELLARRNSWGAMGHTARAHVEQRYSVQNAAKRLLALYQTL